MFPDILLVLGFAVLCAGLRSSSLPMLQRLGNLCVLFTSYLLGWKLTGQPAWGALCALGWLIFPWIDIVTRVRHIQIPTDRPLRPIPPPGPSRFPALDELTEQIEAEGFEQIEDAGWDHDDQRQFVRLFAHPQKNVRATINLVENEEISFYYLTLGSRTPDGVLWCTWNYPFSSSLKPSPNWKIQRLREAQSFHSLLEAHLQWPECHLAGPPSPLPLEAAQLTAEIEAELQSQMEHNVACGLLTHSADGWVRYSWRGCFFLWTQFLRDLLRA